MTPRTDDERELVALGEFVLLMLVVAVVAVIALMAP